jgi:hypothetical protein
VGLKMSATTGSSTASSVMSWSTNCPK